VPVFVTDSPETDNDHVWVTIFKVEVLNGSAQSQTVFDDPAGRAIDVKSLRDASGQRFAFLSDGAVAPGMHTGARVTVGSSLTLFAHGSATGQAVPLDDSVARDAQGHAVISFSLSTPRNLAAGGDDLVIDFDLAHFLLKSGKIAPSLREGDHSGIADKSRHDSDDHDGTVSELAGTAPNLTFTLTVAGTKVKVAADANTVVFKSDSATSPVLANGQTVEVTGTFDTTANTLAAKSIKIEDSSHNGAEAEVEGAPSAIDATAGTFSVSTLKVRGFVPAQTTVRVVTTSTTALRSDGGVVLAAADFFAALAAAQQVEVEGAYDAASNTLTASRASIEHGDADHDGHNVEAQGAAVTVDATAKTFTLQPITEFDGFTLSGNSVNVVTTATTRFRADDATVSAADFFAALAAPQTVQAEGTLSGGALTAASVRIRTSGGGGGGHN
jgi:hypothetical protein